MIVKTVPNKITTAEELSRYLRWCVPFNASESLWGHQGAAQSTGELPDLYAFAYADQRPVYTVYGPDVTPLAWMTRRGVWIVPELGHGEDAKRRRHMILNALKIVNAYKNAGRGL